MLPYIMSRTTITVHTDTGPITAQFLNDEHRREVNDAIANDDDDKLIELVTPAIAVARALTKNVMGHTVELTENELLLDGRPLNHYTASIALRMAKEGSNSDPLLNFIVRCESNPSFRSVQELYKFLEYGQMPLTPSGHFLAYKRVRADYKDVYSGTLDNSVGQYVSMPRNQVDDNSENTCSYGLHFCSYEYLAHFSGERIVVLMIDPANVVSIPPDYNNTKGRCSAYQVVGELPVPKQWDRAVIDDYEPEDEESFDDSEEDEEDWGFF
jgi:hypothetical protein